MTNLQAGARLTAAVVNSALPIYGICTSTTTRTSSTTLQDITGLALTLEANSTYVIDGYLAYTAGATGDLKISVTVPSGATGHWCLYGLSTASTASAGDVDARRQTSFGTGTTVALGGSDSFSSTLAALPRLYVVTASTAGDLTMQMAQNTSNGTATSVNVGTWIRGVRVA